MTGQLRIDLQTTINTTTPGTGTGYGLHFGGQSTSDSATGITFTGAGATQTTSQAGIYVQGSGSYGTRMYIATTDSYAAGSKTAIYINESGLANFLRARPQHNGSNLALVSELPTVNNGTLTLSVSGTGLSGSASFTANQSGNTTFTVTSNATSANTASTIVARDGSGNFSAGTITASLTGSATQLGGYGIDQFRAFSRLNTISMGGSTSTFYPIYFNGDYWGNGVGEIEILRTSVHQDGSSYGSLMSKIRGRSTSWGHHFDFWESEIYISNGTYHPFIAAAQGHPTCSNFLIWLKGGLSYYWRSDSPMSVSDAGATSKTISCGGSYTFNTKSSIDADFTAGYRWYMTGISPRSNNTYDLGTSSYRWGTVYGVTGNFSGDVIAYASSDERLKENIKPIEEPVKKTQSISGVEFDWNETLQSIYKGHDIGVIAQEIEKVLPELVTTRGDGYKAVKYEKIVALLIEAIKEQQSSIEKLESRIERLENGF